MMSLTWPTPSPWRIEQFRSAHRVGDIVRGELLSYADHDRAWVRMSELVVLASIRPGLHPDAQLTFRVQSLHPEIILKELQPVGQTWAKLQTFAALRQHFETRCKQEHGPNWATQHAELLARHAELQELLAEISHAVNNVNSSLHHGQQIAYRPDILCGLDNSVLIFTPALPGTTITEILGHGHLPSQHVVWVQTCLAGGQTRTLCFAPPPVSRSTTMVGQELLNASKFSLHSPWERLQMNTDRRTFEATI